MSGLMPSPPILPPDSPMIPVSRYFVAWYAAAQVGAYIAFVPLLSLLLPLKAAIIDPSGGAELLSEVAFWGALTASVAGVLAGLIGDRTRHWPGGRGLWMALGLAGTLASYSLINAAEGRVALILAIVALQIGLNFMLNALAATLPERVPGHQKGMVAAFGGLAFPLASLFGAIVVGVWLTTGAHRLTAIILVSGSLVLPFVVMTFRAVASISPAQRDHPTLDALWDRDFLFALVSRLLVHSAIALNILYLLIFLDNEAAITEALPGTRIEAVAGGLFAMATVLSVISGLIGGYVSDRVGRRRILVFIGAALLAAGALVMALMPAWPGALIAQALMGLGIGLYLTTDTVLVAEVLPGSLNAGQNLGIMNVSVTAAQMLAPLVGLITLARFGGDLRVVYLVGAALATLGAIVIIFVRRVR